MCFMSNKLPPAAIDGERENLTIDEANNSVTILNAPNIRIYKVSTGSMKPLLAIGSFGIFTQNVNTNDLCVGHDLVFEDEEVYMKGVYVLHRIIEVGWDAEGWKCRTQGLNNSKPDKGWRRPSEIRGRLIGVYNG